MFALKVGLRLRQRQFKRFWIKACESLSLRHNIASTNRQLGQATTRRKAQLLRRSRSHFARHRQNLAHIAAPSAPLVRLSVNGELTLRVFVPMSSLPQVRVGDTLPV